MSSYSVASDLPPLHAAAGLGDLAAVRRLLAADADPNALERGIGAAPIHLAAQSGDAQVGAALRDAGAFVDLQAPSHGMTALMVAVWHRRVEFVTWLLSLPEINIGILASLGVTAEQLVGFGSPPGDVAAPVDERIRAEFAAYRARRAAVLADQPVFRALVTGTDDDAVALVREGAAIDTVSPRDGTGSDAHTPLHVAARDGRAGTVRALLDAGADQTVPDAYMESLPVHKAASNGHAGVIGMLVADRRFEEVADAQGPFNGYTPLHDAVWHGHLEAARVLVDAGVSTDVPGWDGRTARDLAADSGYTDVVALVDERRNAVG